MNKKVQKTSLFNLVFTNYPLRTMTFGHLFHRYLGAQKNLAFARFVLAPTIDWVLPQAGPPRAVRFAQRKLALTNYPLRTMTFGHLFHRYLGAQKNLAFARFVLAPTIWFEQMTDRLTADCSTAELSRNKLGGRYRNWTDIKGFAVLCMSHSANRPPVPNSLVISIYTNIFARVNSFFTKSAFFLHMCKKSLFLNAIL